MMRGTLFVRLHPATVTSWRRGRRRRRAMALLVVVLLADSADTVTMIARAAGIRAPGVGVMSGMGMGIGRGAADGIKVGRLFRS